MKRFVLAVLAFVAVAIAVSPATTAVAAAQEEPGSGTLTWAVPTIV
ncbi:hypothetical protein [Amycolatopsis sp. GM8]|nr:hypothetical protein [Amycolatopsis sp. GM8]